MVFRSGDDPPASTTFFRLASSECCFKKHKAALFGLEDGFAFLSIPVQEIPEKDG